MLRVSSASMKQATKLVLCRSTPMWRISAPPPYVVGGQGERRLLGVAPRSYPGSSVPLRGAGGGSRRGHTVGRDQKSHNGIRPSPRLSLATSFCSRACYTERCCLYHDLLGAVCCKSTNQEFKFSY